MEIIFEDKYIIVIHKPHNLPTQTAKLTQKDVVSELKNHLKINNKDPYVGIVHRLDQNVEGLLVFAKDKEVAAILSKQLSEDTFCKEYLAKVSGNLPEGRIKLEDYLYSDSKSNVTKVVSPDYKGAKKSILFFEKIDNNLVKIYLKTGRKHQIRVQMANAGFPILGDLKYGNGEKSLSNRLCLMAYHLAFLHPKTGEKLDFELPITLTKTW